MTKDHLSDRGSLDPQDWTAFRERAHAMLDNVIDHMENYGRGGVWQEPDADLAASFNKDLPVDPGNPDEIYDQLRPFGVGNTHPRFFGWVHGSGTPSNLMAEMNAAAMNVNLGGRHHGGAYVEKQINDWVRALFGFPDTASGLLVSGTSIATLIAVKTARDRQCDFTTRHKGTNGNLVGYTSSEAHSCIKKAFDILGLGSDALRGIQVDRDYKIDIAALKTAVSADRKAGKTPFLVVGSVGAVNTGAIDDLPALVDFCADEGLWLHIDGAFGAAAIMSDTVRPRLAGIERADSIAFDFHKWLHVNYDAGYVLIRHGDAHLRSFSERPDYLQGADRGLASGNPWPTEYGPELSRGFRALRVWSQLTEHGTLRLGEAITRNCEQAAWLGDEVSNNPKLELLCPVALNICCFRYICPDPDKVNDKIVILLHERGIAVPSTTRIEGHIAIRINITNHRTQTSDLAILRDAVIKIGDELTT